MATMISARRIKACDGNRGQLRTNMVPWWLQGFPIDHKYGLCSHSVRHSLRVL